ncbi:MAG: haloacid dehalogenase-like hydrolase [Myxococcaceae bacterium]|nr:haloacid dehalogenase-like hydrolase [Myxococcaceae bacterium]
MTLEEVSAPAVRALLAPLLDGRARGKAAVFDADGTLWRGDVGEELLRHLAARGALPSLAEPRAAFHEYERRHAVDPVEAYAFNAQVLAGLSEAQLEEDCAALVKQRFEGRIFRFTRPWLEALSGAGLEVWICSASPIWVVEAGAALLGIPKARCLGARCAVDAGVVTARLEGPVPAGDGKVTWLERRGLRPALAVGNGELDEPMLRFAERAIVVAPHGDEGNGLVRAAVSKGWPIQRG